MYLLVQPQHLQSLKTSSRSHSFLLKSGTHGKFTQTHETVSMEPSIHRGYLSGAGSTPGVMASVGPQCLWNSDPTLWLMTWFGLQQAQLCRAPLRTMAGQGQLEWQRPPHRAKAEDEMVSLPSTTLHLSFCLSVDRQHQQQRNRQPKDFPASIPGQQALTGGQKVGTC